MFEAVTCPEVTYYLFLQEWDYIGSLRSYSDF